MAARVARAVEEISKKAIVKWRICCAREGERLRGWCLVVVTCKERGLAALFAFAVASREVVVSSATPARGGRAMQRAPRRLGRGRERVWFLCRA